MFNGIKEFNQEKQMILTAQEKASTLRRLIVRKEWLEQQASQVGKEVWKLSTEMVDAMMEEGVDEITIEGLKFKIKDEINFSMQNTDAKKWVECPDFLAWLEEQGDIGIVKEVPTIHPQTLKSYLKKKQEEGCELPPVVKVTPVSIINWNKSQIEREVNEIKKPE